MIAQLRHSFLFLEESNHGLELHRSFEKLLPLKSCQSRTEIVRALSHFSLTKKKHTKKNKQQPGQYLALSLHLLDAAPLGSGVTRCCDGFWRRHLRDSRESTRHRATPSESGAKRWQRFTNQDGELPASLPAPPSGERRFSSSSSTGRRRRLWRAPCSGFFQCGAAPPSDRRNPSTQPKFFRKLDLKKSQFRELSLVVAGLGPDDRLLAAKLLIDVCFPAF